jgi:DNA-binding MarR family transcriptional regulator
MAKLHSPVLHELLGYHARRMSLYAIDLFVQAMSKQPKAQRLKVVEFSVLSLVAHNPGVTSRQICAALGLLPPNLVGMIQRFEKNAWLTRQPHPQDGRALGLHLSAAGKQLIAKAEALTQRAEQEVTKNLSEKEQTQLKNLLRKAYKSSQADTSDTSEKSDQA